MILDKSGTQTDQPLSVAAYSDRFKPHELVDVTHYAGINTHYALNLPAGSYDLLVLADKDKNNMLEQSEVVGRRQVELKANASKEKVLTDFDINLSNSSEIDWNINIPVLQTPEMEQSLVYPKGSIRRLDDPIFDQVNWIGTFPLGALVGAFHYVVLSSRKLTIFYFYIL